MFGQEPILLVLNSVGSPKASRSDVQDHVTYGHNNVESVSAVICHQIYFLASFEQLTMMFYKP